LPTLTVTGDIAGIRQALSRVVAIGHDPSAVLAAAGLGLEDNVHARFDAGEDPDGQPWAPLNPLYAADKPPGLPVLTLSHHLRNSIVSEANGSVLTVGTDVKYAAVHQFGAVIEPKEARQLSFEMGGRLFHRRSVTMPARPYLGWSNRDYDTMIENLEAYLTSAMRV